MTRIKKRGVRWEMMDGQEGLLDQLLAEKGESVKLTPTKLVTRHQLAGGTYYVKRYRNEGVALRPLKYFFKPSEARSEWKIAGQYHALGIPLVRHLALGERWGAMGLRESILITEGFSGVPLSRSDLHQRADVQSALGTLLKLMHDKGILQPDLHHNILVREEPFELRRIDVDRSEVKAQLSSEDRFENLAFLNIFVPLGDRFFETYGGPAEWPKRIDERSAAIRRPLAARRSRRAVETNLRFDVFRHGGVRWWVRLEAYDEKLKSQLSKPRQAVEGFTVRRFAEKGRLFQTSPALRAHQNAYHLELLEIPTARSLAAGERRFLGFLTASYAVTEAIPGETDLKRAEEIDFEVAWDAGKVVGQFHANGFTHGHWTEESVLWGDAGKVQLSTLESVTYHKAYEKRAAQRDLMALWRVVAKYRGFTKAHRKAFLQAYRQECP